MDYSDEEIEKLRRQYIEAEFGHPLDSLGAGMAEQAGGLSEAAGYIFDLPTLEVVADRLTDYIESGKPKDRDSTPYETAANFVGRAVVPLIANRAGESAVRAVFPAVATSALGRGLVAPFAFGHVMEDLSETGTVLNALRRQGYSRDELDDAAKETMLNEYAAGILGTYPYGLSTRLGSRAAKKIAKFTSPAINEYFQNDIFDKQTNKER